MAEDKETQEVDLNDADVSAESERPRGTRPPPLPPEASLPPHSPSRASYVPPPAPPRPSAAPPPAAKRSAGLYAGLIGAFVVVGVGGGAGVALYLKKTNPPAGAPSAAASATSQKPAVITIPTVEMDDAPDAGP